MTCIDTTVLIDLFAGREAPHVARFEALIAQREDLCLCDVILTEVLQGIKEALRHRKSGCRSLSS